MRYFKKLLLPLVLFSLFGSLAQISPSTAGTTVPGVPTITKISSSKVHVIGGKRLIDITVNVAKPSSGGSVSFLIVSNSKVTCSADLGKGSCVLRNVLEKSILPISVRAKNTKGFGPASAAIKYIAGSISWPGVPVYPKIFRLSSINSDVTLNFSPPVNSGGTRIVNYSYSVDGGVHWKLRSPASVKSPLRIGNVSKGAHKFMLRAINGSGIGLASQASTHRVSTKSFTKLPIKFKSLLSSRGLVVQKKQAKIARAGFRAASADPVEEETSEVNSITETGELESAIASQTAPVNIDRIFIGPHGRTLATLGSIGEESCTVAEINPATGNTVCVAYYNQASLGGLAWDFQQLNEQQPIYFDAQDNAYLGNSNSLIEITTDATVKRLTAQGTCVQNFKIVKPNRVVAWTNECGNSVSKSLVFDTSGAEITNKPICDCMLFVIALSPDGRVLIGDEFDAFYLLDIDDMSKTNFEFENSAELVVPHALWSSKLLPDGRLVAIPQMGGSYMDERWLKPNPLIQYLPQTAGQANSFELSNVPVPFMLAEIGNSSVVAVGLDEPEKCWRYGIIFSSGRFAACSQEARMSMFNFETKVETPIDLLNATGGSDKPMNITFLSGNADNTQILFVGVRADTLADLIHENRQQHVLGTVDVASGETIIKDVEGLLGVAAY